MALTGEPIWLELNTTDMTKARAFYTGLFGWAFEDSGPDYGHYQMVQAGTHYIAGGMAIDHERTPELADNWTIYLASSDVAATTAAAEEAGASVIMPPMQVGGAGTMAFVIDPTGATVGIWQGDGTPGIGTLGTDDFGSAGTPCWFELMTNDYAAAFDWDVQPMGPQGGEWQYSTMGAGDAAKAGICDAGSFVPAGANSYWRTYFAVADTDAALDRLTSLGGRLLDGPADTPFGRIATVTDDQGAMFQLLQPPAR